MILIIGGSYQGKLDFANHGTLALNNISYMPPKVQSKLFEYIDTKYPEIPESIRTEKEMKPEVEEKLVKAIEDFKKNF